MDVSVLALGNLNEIIAAIDATDVVEAFTLEVSCDKTLAAAHFEHFALHPIHGTQVSDHV